MAKSVALKTYSSGPRGGLEGTRALADRYGLRHVLMMDVGGTTTDVGRWSATARSTSTGAATIERVADLVPDEQRALQHGVGGSSVIRRRRRPDHGRAGQRGRRTRPGLLRASAATRPRSPTCNLLLGVLDPATYLGGSCTSTPDAPGR